MRIILLLMMLFFSDIMKMDAVEMNHLSSDKSDISKETQAFKGVKVAGSKGNYFISGESKTQKGSFFYTVEDGYNELIKERKWEANNMGSGWQPFTIHMQIPKEKLPTNGSVMLVLYERDNRGRISQSYPIILEHL